MSWFVEVPPEYADDHRLAVAAVKQAARELDIPEPALRWFMLSDRERAAAWKLGEAFEEDERPLVVGKSEQFPNTVWIRTGLDRDQMLVTVGHEVRHLRQPPGQYDEADAERFGRRFAAEFGSRPTATKSLNWLPSAEFDRSGNMTAIVPLPSAVRSMTDRSVDLRGQDHPLMATGWGVRGERIGQLVDAAASEEELWFKAQVDKHNRYMAHVRRLIEQGAIDFKPSAAAGFQRRPLLTVTAMPAAA